ncbi:MAG: hypothetical protein PHN45_05030 [Methylococcales bacterium]|nr:hypothetical protein [Methylococcales bacterium]
MEETEEERSRKRLAGEQTQAPAYKLARQEAAARARSSYMSKQVFPQERDSPRSPQMYDVNTGQMHTPQEMYYINNARMQQALSRYVPSSRAKQPKQKSETQLIVESQTFRTSSEVEALARAAQEGTKVVRSKNKETPFLVRTRQYYTTRRQKAVESGKVRTRNQLKYYQDRQLVAISQNIPTIKPGFQTTIVQRPNRDETESLKEFAIVYKPIPGKYNCIPKWFIDYKNKHPELAITYLNVGFVRQGKGKKDRISPSIIWQHPSGTGYAYFILVPRVMKGSKTNVRDPVYISQTVALKAVYAYAKRAASARDRLGGLNAARVASQRLLNGADNAGWMKINKAFDQIGTIKPLYNRTLGGIPTFIIFVTAGRIFLKTTTTDKGKVTEKQRTELAFAKTRYPLLLDGDKMNATLRDRNLDTYMITLNEVGAFTENSFSRVPAFGAGTRCCFRTIEQMPADDPQRSKSPIKAISWDKVPSSARITAPESIDGVGYPILYASQIFGNKAYTDKQLKIYMAFVKILSKAMAIAFTMAKATGDDIRNWLTFAGLPSTPNGWNDPFTVMRELTTFWNSVKTSTKGFGDIDPVMGQEFSNRMKELDMYDHRQSKPEAV